MVKIPMRGILALLAFVVSCSGGNEEEAIQPGQWNGTVSHYHFNFDLSTKAATTTLTFVTETDGDCLTLPFRAGELTSVTTLNGEQATARKGGGLLEVCGTAAKAGAILTIQVAHSVPEATWEDSQVGYSEWNDDLGNPFHYLVSWVGGCDRFGPCDSQPDQFSSYTFEVTHPAGTQVLCPGKITATNTITTCETDFSAPTYSAFGIAASKSWQAHDLGQWNGVQVTLFDIPGSQTQENFSISKHRDFLSWMENNFGDYPYGDELRFVVGPTYWGGFEHPGNIVLSDGLATNGFSAFKNALEHTVNHEIAHMWAGDQTTLLGVYDFAWKEAMAEYLTYLFDTVDDPESAQLANAAWHSFANNADHYPVPEERPPLLDYYGDAYGPGPMVLFRQLEALYSRENMLTALKALLGKQRAIGIADVKEELEKATGDDLSDYFNAWVYGQGKPTWLRISLDVSVDNEILTVTAQDTTNSEKTWPCTFSVKVTSRETGETATVRLFSGIEGQPQLQGSSTVSAGFIVDSGYTLAPNKECLVYESTPTATFSNEKVNPWLTERAKKRTKRRR